METQSQSAAQQIQVNAIQTDSPPIDGFIPWIAVTTTDERNGELELDAVPSFGVVGNYLTSNPQSDFGIGLFDTGASVHVMGNGTAISTGLFDADLNTGGTIQIDGVTGSVDAWVSQPLGLFMTGLSEVDPTTLLVDDSSMVGQWNVAIAVGQQPAPGAPDLPTVIGSPMAAYYATHIQNDQPITLSRGGEDFTGPNISFHATTDVTLPEYPNVIPMQLIPLGVASVQYFFCIASLEYCPGGDFSPKLPSFLIGNSAQSLFFVSSVDLYDGTYSAIDRDRFMYDTGAQVTVVGNRVGSRLGLDGNNPEFLVEIQGVDGQLVMKPGFIIDRLEIPAIGQWLTYTDVPVVLLDVASPEGGTLDGIIGMNLFVNYNFVLRGGGIAGEPDPTLECEPIQVAENTPDFDLDGDVDMIDFGHLQTCLTGPDIEQTDPDCHNTRLDEDLDVDQDDLDLFITCASGPDVPAAPGCTP